MCNGWIARRGHKDEVGDTAWAGGYLEAMTEEALYRFATWQVDGFMVPASDYRWICRSARNESDRRHTPSGVAAKVPR